jgi:hypothetical protein
MFLCLLSIFDRSPEVWKGEQSPCTVLVEARADGGLFSPRTELQLTACPAGWLVLAELRLTAVTAGWLPLAELQLAAAGGGQRGLPAGRLHRCAAARLQGGCRAAQLGGRGQRAQLYRPGWLRQPAAGPPPGRGGALPEPPSQLPCMHAASSMQAVSSHHALTGSACVLCKARRSSSRR